MAQNGVTGGRIAIVETDVRGLRKLHRSVRQIKVGTPPPDIKRALDQWANIYQAYIKERYLRNATGGGGRGGQWKGHAPSTVAKRGVNAPILIMFGDLFRHAASWHKIIKTPNGVGIEVGYPPGVRHPRANMPIRRLADIHQNGTTFIPARPIIISAPLRIQAQMAEVMEIAYLKLVIKAGLI